MISDRKFFFLSSGIIAVLSIAMILCRIFAHSFLLSNDSYTYLYMTRSILEKGWIQTLPDFNTLPDLPPLLLLLLLGSCKCGWSPAVIGLMLNYLGIILACQGVLWCSFRIYKNRITALASAILVCSLPKIYIEGCNIQRDPLFWAEIVWLVYFLLRFSSLESESSLKVKRDYFLCTLVIAFLNGLGCLTRKEGLLFFGIAFPVFCILTFRNRTLPLKFRIALCLLHFILVVFLFYLPWLCGVPLLPGNFLFSIDHYLGGVS